MDRLDIGAQYFGFYPVGGHGQECPLLGTNVWEVTRHRVERYPAGEPYVSEVTLRMHCPKCGMVHFQTGDGDSSETTHVSQIGYGTKPERCCGLWLHAGPPLISRDGYGPYVFYVTGSPEPPTSPADVIGAVSHYFSPRRALRWMGAHGCRYQGEGKVHSNQDGFKSRRAAVQWVVDQHAAVAVATAKS